MICVVGYYTNFTTTLNVKISVVVGTLILFQGWHEYSIFQPTYDSKFRRFNNSSIRLLTFLKEDMITTKMSN